MRPWPLIVTLAGCLLIGGPAIAVSGPDSAETPARREARIESAYGAAIKGGIFGPAVVPLEDQGRLALPKGLIFVSKKAANAYLEQLGNGEDDTVLGLIVSNKGHNAFMMVASSLKVGHIRDQEAASWKAEALLEDLRSGIEFGNLIKRVIGMPEGELVGWLEKPTYDAKRHLLVWAAGVRRKGAPDSRTTVNYNAHLLGREGYIGLNMLTSEAQLTIDKPIARQLQAAMTFAKGKRYEDFDPATDKVAETGLAGLVTGMGSTGVWLFMALVLLAVKGYKLIALGLVALAGMVVSRLVRKKKVPEAPVEAPTSESPETSEVGASGHPGT